MRQNFLMRSLRTYARSIINKVFTKEQERQVHNHLPSEIIGFLMVFGQVFGVGFGFFVINDIKSLQCSDLLHPLTT